MRICITGHIATADLAHLLDDGGRGLPAGYLGAPLMGVLVNELIAAGHQVVAVTTDSSLPLQDGKFLQARGPGLDLRICPARPRAWRPNGRLWGRAVDMFAWERRQVAGAIVSSGAQVVHAHWSYEFALAALDSGLPHLVTCHDSPRVVLKHTRSVYRAVRYLMARQVFKRARNLTAVSSYMADELAHFTRQPVSVVPNPLAHYVLDMPPKHQMQAGGVRIAMVCNGWSDFKNPKRGIAGFARFRSKHPDSELHCFGDDFGPGQLAQRWARQMNLDAGVHFQGRQPHRDLVRSLARLDVLLHPALEESFGVVLAEAMALGLPVVAGVSSGAVPWVVLGDDASADPAAPGVLTNVGDAQAIADALSCVVDASRYGVRSRAASESARARFAPAQVANQYLCLYDAVLARGVAVAPDSLTADGAVHP